MTVFKTLYCKARMAAYVNGQLSPQARRRVARFMDECPACYDEYLQQRALQQELSATLSTFGRPDDGQLRRIWEGVAAEIAPRSKSVRLRPLRWRVGLATLIVLFLLVVPMVFGAESFTMGVITPPTPDLTMVAVATQPANYTVMTGETAITTHSTQAETQRMEATPPAEPIITMEVSPAAANTPDVNH